ncbi:MAG: NurA nuclease domain protein [candidate division TM6 bacterium GW2011_GWF2_36_6]|nr:MAG: NurA nuclease domain protein [candidate division TM6 bacterium GW2011_GWF2_36_6]
MLDRSKLAALLQTMTSLLFPANDDKQWELACAGWDRICTDQTFKERAARAQASFLMPLWDGALGDRIPCKIAFEHYVVAGCDGSQIYPDRHLSGAGCFVVNAGGCVLHYAERSSVSFFSEPQVMLNDYFVETIGSFSPDIVDFQREAYELEKAYRIAITYHEQELLVPYVGLFDGTLIFWHLEGKSPEIRDYFLMQYLQTLQLYYAKKMLIAGYISMPKSRELINLISLGMCRFDTANCIACHHAFHDFPCKQIDHIIDAQLCDYFLPIGSRTTIFYSQSHIVEYYPEHLRPAFFYLNVGFEIARVEIPAWIAQDASLVDVVCSVLLDQVKKGNGYPVALSEAHEQAVIRGADRDFFYHLLGKQSIDHQRRLVMSPKSIKKKGIGI